MFKAYWTESGTNYSMQASAPTMEELNRKVYGGAYSPKYGSVRCYWDEPMDNPTDGRSVTTETLDSVIG
jgi:hypothetical protein